MYHKLLGHPKGKQLPSVVLETFCNGRAAASPIRAKSGADICHCQVKFGSMATLEAGGKGSATPARRLWPMLRILYHHNIFSQPRNKLSVCSSNNVGSTAVSHSGRRGGVLTVSLDMKLFCRVPRRWRRPRVERPRSIDNLEDARRRRSGGEWRLQEVPLLNCCWGVKKFPRGSCYKM